MPITTINPSQTDGVARRAARFLRRAAWMLAALLLAGCGTVGYYGQAIRGHLALMQAARPIDDWLRDPATPPKLKQRLELARRIRAFAVSELDLPDNASYHSYADLHRPAALWNVVAAPPDSLRLKQWCFLFVGCVGYRGYFHKDAAVALAARLRAKDDLEVLVYGVPAYSTFGWFNWAGGDPLLSTFVDGPDGELARLIFHELAHQKLYVRGDTAFNESYATAVERLGVRRWLRQRASAQARRAYALFDQRRRAFRALVRQTRAELAQVYQVHRDHSDVPWRRKKAEVMARFGQQYQALKTRWAAAGTPFDGYDRWVARANNASFGLQAAYDGWVPAFEALFACVGRDWPRFYGAVRQLADWPEPKRHATLDAWMHDAAGSGSACALMGKLAQPASG